MDDLYFIKAGEFVKIGRSGNPRQRLRQVRCHSPIKAEIVGTVVGKGWQERVWHFAFAEWRGEGEWFALTTDLLRAIRRTLAGEEWIATLVPNAGHVECARRHLDRWPNLRAYHGSVRNCAKHLWRNMVADIEENREPQ